MQAGDMSRLCRSIGSIKQHTKGMAQQRETVEFKDIVTLEIRRGVLVMRVDVLLCGPT